MSKRRIMVTIAAILLFVAWVASWFGGRDERRVPRHAGPPDRELVQRLVNRAYAFAADLSSTMARQPMQQLRDLGAQRTRDRVLEIVLRFGASKDQSDSDECIDDLMALWERDPKCPEAAFAAGFFLHRFGEAPAETVLWFRRGLKLDPDPPHVHRLLANALFDVGALDEAIAAARHAYERTPDSHYAAFVLGRRLRSRGDLVESRFLLERSTAARSFGGINHEHIEWLHDLIGVSEPQLSPVLDADAADVVPVFEIGDAIATGAHGFDLTPSLTDPPRFAIADHSGLLVGPAGALSRVIHGSLREVALSDMDHDGQDDWIVATDSAIEIHRSGDPDHQTSLQLPARLRSVTPVDQDRTGPLDLLAIDRDSATLRLIRLSRRSEPPDRWQFADASADIGFGDGVSSFLVDDLDNDGDRDLVTCGEDGAVTLFRSQYDGRVTEAWPVPLDHPATSVGAADTDGDGDVEVCCIGGGVLSSLSAPLSRTATFAARRSTIVSADAQRMAWLDVDNDGDLDLAVGGLRESTILRNDRGRLDEVERLPIGGSRQLIADDIDLDGRCDLIGLGEDGRVLPALNRSDVRPALRIELCGPISNPCGEGTRLRGSRGLRQSVAVVRSRVVLLARDNEHDLDALYVRWSDGTRGVVPEPCQSSDWLIPLRCGHDGREMPRLEHLDRGIRLHAWHYPGGHYSVERRRRP